jgi:hypothetical protein
MEAVPRYRITIETCVEAVSALQARALSEIAADAAVEAVSRHYTPAPDDGALYTINVGGIDIDAHNDLGSLREDEREPDELQRLIDDEKSPPSRHVGRFVTLFGRSTGRRTRALTTWQNGRRINDVISDVRPVRDSVDYADDVVDEHRNPADRIHDDRRARGVVMMAAPLDR